MNVAALVEQPPDLLIESDRQASSAPLSPSTDSCRSPLPPYCLVVRVDSASSALSHPAFRTPAQRCGAAHEAPRARDIIRQLFLPDARRARTSPKNCV
jgi:hypothetical protein